MTVKVSNIGDGKYEPTPNPIRLALFLSVPAWRRFRSLHQVPDLPGEFIHTRNRVYVAVRDSYQLLLMGITQLDLRSNLSEAPSYD